MPSSSSASEESKVGLSNRLFQMATQGGNLKVPEGEPPEQTDEERAAAYDKARHSVDDILLDGDQLWAASKIIGRDCASQNLAYLECKEKDANPRTCLDQGSGVISCVRGVIEKVRASECRDGFDEWKNCLRSAQGRHFLHCRDLQRTFEACFEEKNKK